MVSDIEVYSIGTDCIGLDIVYNPEVGENHIHNSDSDSLVPLVHRFRGALLHVDEVREDEMVKEDVFLEEHEHLT